MQRALEREQVVVRDAQALRQQRLKAFAENVVAIERQRAVAQTMEGMFAIDDPGPPGRRTGELDGRLDRFRAGIGKEHLVEIGHPLQEPLGQNSGQHRHVELHQVGQVAVEHAFERLAHVRMIAADREHAEAAEQVQIAGALAVVEIGALAAAEADVIADGAQDPHHLLVEMAAVQPVAFGLALVMQGGDIVGHARSPCWFRSLALRDDGGSVLRFVRMLAPSAPRMRATPES